MAEWKKQNISTSFKTIVYIFHYISHQWGENDDKKIKNNVLGYNQENYKNSQPYNSWLHEKY